MYTIVQITNYLVGLLQCYYLPGECHRKFLQGKIMKMIAISSNQWQSFLTMLERLSYTTIITRLSDISSWPWYIFCVMKRVVVTEHECTIPYSHKIYCRSDKLILKLHARMIPHINACFSYGPRQSTDYVCESCGTPISMLITGCHNSHKSSPWPSHDLFLCILL